MGLDITAFRKLTAAKNGEGLDASGEVDWKAGWSRLYHNSDFPGRADDVPEGIYRANDSMGFRAGSYSGYNRWREKLAALVGVIPRELWENPKPGPFAELINFSDCDGVIGTAISKKLAADFAEHQANADAHEDAWFRDGYAMWRKAFEMASDGGAVQFH